MGVLQATTEGSPQFDVFRPLPFAPQLLPHESNTGWPQATVVALGQLAAL